MNLPARNIDHTSLSITRLIKASPEKVFKAWTDPSLLTRWFGPHGVTTTAAKVDLRIGGKYQFTMQEPDGTRHHPNGEYRIIDPPKKLVFTWILDGQGCSGSDGHHAETLVTIELEDVNGSCRLTLTHDFLPSEESKAAHNMGWTGSLDRLEALAE